MTEAEILRVLMRAEDGIARRVAERALQATDPEHTRVLRSVWRMASERAEHLAAMVLEAESTN